MYSLMDPLVQPWQKSHQHLILFQLDQNISSQNLSRMKYSASYSFHQQVRDYYWVDITIMDNVRFVINEAMTSAKVFYFIPFHSISFHRSLIMQFILVKSNLFLLESSLHQRMELPPSLLLDQSNSLIHSLLSKQESTIILIQRDLLLKENMLELVI